MGGLPLRTGSCHKAPSNPDRLAPPALRTAWNLPANERVPITKTATKTQCIVLYKSKYLARLAAQGRSLIKAAVKK